MSKYPILPDEDEDMEEAFKEINKNINKQKRDYNWGDDLLNTLSDIGSYMHEKQNVVLSIDTDDWTFMFDLEPEVKRPKKIREAQDFKTKFMTWEEVSNFIRGWVKGGFKHSVKSNKKRQCVNRAFRLMKVFKTERGYLISNMFDITYPENILINYTHLKKPHEFHRNYRTERTKEDRLSVTDQQ